MEDSGDKIVPGFDDLRQRQIEVQRDKFTNRTLELYNDTFQFALPEGILAFLKNNDATATWVDIGCGNGSALDEAARSNIIGMLEIIGVDIRDNTQLASHYQKFNPKSRSTGLYYSNQNLDGNVNLVLPKNCNLITCLMVDRYLKDVIPMTVGAINALSENGVFLMTSSSKHYVRDRKWKSQDMLHWYLRNVLKDAGGSLEVVQAGNKDRHLGDIHTDVWVMRKGKKYISVNYELNYVTSVSGGGYSQEYWVD